MTHAELRATYPAPGSIEPTDCPGEVAFVQVLDDPAADDHQVEVYHCPRCGHRIAVDRTVGITRNEYPGPGNRARGVREGGPK